MEGNVFNVLRSSANPKTIHRHNVLTYTDTDTKRPGRARSGGAVYFPNGKMVFATPQKLTLWTRSHEGLVQIRRSFSSVGGFLGSQDFSSSKVMHIFTFQKFQPWPAAGLVPPFRPRDCHQQLQRHIPKTEHRNDRTKRQRDIPSGLSPFLAMRWQARRNVVPRTKDLQHVRNGGKKVDR